MTDQTKPLTEEEIAWLLEQARKDRARITQLEIQLDQAKARNAELLDLIAGEEEDNDQ